MSDFWFKPKTHGYGAQPANWKGWAATVGFALFGALLTVPFIVVPVVTSGSPSIAGIAVYAVLFLASLFGFLRLCRLKTDGEWKWRWGDEG